MEQKFSFLVYNNDVGSTQGKPYITLQFMCREVEWFKSLGWRPVYQINVTLKSLI